MAVALVVYNKIRAQIIDDNTEVLNTMYDRIYRAIRDLEDLKIFRCNRETVTYTTAEDTRLLSALPTDWNGIRRDPYYVDGNGDHTRMDWIPDSEELSKSYSANPLDKGPPACVLINQDDQLDVYPLPDALCPTGDLYSDGNYRVVISYWKRLDQPTAGETNFFLADNSLTLQYVEEKVTAECMLYNRDMEQWTNWLGKAQLTMRQIKREYKSQMIPRNLHLAPRRSVNAGRKQTRL